MRNGWIRLAAMVAMAAITCCQGREPVQVCPVPFEIGSLAVSVGGFEGVDLLLVVDGSSLMESMQRALASDVHGMLDALVAPPASWQYPAIDDVRVAVVFADMDDDGRFSIYRQGRTVVIDGATMTCPPLDRPWVETSAAAGNPELSLAGACLAAVGADGGGAPQPLAAAIAALDREDQRAFRRPLALLSVVVVGNRDDCSTSAPGFFEGLPAFACALEENEQHLHAVDQLHARLLEVAGHQSAIAFSAITGVPMDDACQGRGNQIDGCLDHPAMQVAQVPDAQGPDGWTLEPACTRQVDTAPAAAAWPARRLVELARRFGHMARVRSVCEDDWSPAVENIAMLATPACPTCFPKPLDWNPATKTAVCNLVAEYIDETCPPIFGEVEPAVHTFTDALGELHHRVLCPVPRLPANLSCTDNDFSDGDPYADAFGWYYCENISGLEAENFNQICDDGLDNDGDGLTDCDDPDCGPCEVCGGDGVGCEKNCRYEVGLTVAAQWELRFKSLLMMCPWQFSHGDPNCQENSFAACNDGLDNDGNGIRDCDTVLDGDQLSYADFNCCPMTVDEKHRCQVLTHDYCPGSSDADWSDACREHAALLGCIP